MMYRVDNFQNTTRIAKNWHHARSRCAKLCGVQQLKSLNGYEYELLRRKVRTD